MALYKLTKGTLSRIRTKQEDIQALIDEGYTLDGEVDEKFNLLPPKVETKEDDPLNELREQLISLGCPKSTASRYKSEKTLLKKIEEFKES